MDLEDLDIEFDWSQVDMLNSITPSLLNNPAYGLQQVHVPNVQDSVGTVVVTANQAQNTQHTFSFHEEATSSSRINPPQLVVDDHNQLPQLTPNSSAQLLDETQQSYYIPSMVGLISEGEGSSVQGQDMTPMNYYNHFSRMQDNNLPMMHDLGRHNHYTSNQMLVPNVLANNNFNIIDPQPSSYPAFFQQNPMEAGAGNETTNGHFMTDQRSPLYTLNNHAINPRSTWNSPRSLWVQDQGKEYNPLLHNPGFQQQSSTLNGPTALSSAFITCSALNSAILGLSGTEGSSSQVFNTEAPQIPSPFRPERASEVQLQQVPPFSMNSITPQRADNGFPISSSFGAQPSVPILSMLNQNDRSTVTSYGPYTTLQQNSSLNLQFERQGQREAPRRGRPRKRFEPGEASSPYKRRKKCSSARQNAGKTPVSQANKCTPDGVVKEEENANPSSAATPSQCVNAMYDPAFERAGIPIDPLLRLLNAKSENPAGSATTT